MEKTSSEMVYQYILDKIKSSELNPDDRVQSENELSEEMHVSRLSVRQAFEKLEALGLIIKKKGSGTYINHPDNMEKLENFNHVMEMGDEDIQSILEFRKYFEYGNVCLFIENRSEEDMKRLETIIQNMNHTDDIHNYGELDYEFHNLIAEGTKNNIVIRVQQILMSLLKEQQMMLSERIGHSVGNSYHQSIYQALVDRDSELAATLMMRHIEAAITSFEDVVGGA